MKQCLSYSGASELGSVLHAALQTLRNMIPLSDADPGLMAAMHKAHIHTLRFLS